MFKRISYAFGLIFFIIFAFLILKNANLNNFIDTIENRTFDLRQSILINEGSKKASQDIVIVAIDDATYEYILDNYGEWPLPRDIYAKIVNDFDLDVKQGEYASKIIENELFEEENMLLTYPNIQIAGTKYNNTSVAGLYKMEKTYYIQVFSESTN